jgi:alanine racemase
LYYNKKALFSANTNPFSSEITDNPQAEVLVDPSRINHNLDQFAGSHQLAPVIKSNAYGHGLELVADVLRDRNDVPFACVAALREVQRLRANDSNLSALVIGYTPTGAICSNQLPNTAFAITSLDQLRELDRQLQQAQDFHLKVETGMHRYGIRLNQLDQAVDIIAGNSLINLQGVFSHFSDAYEPDSEFTRQQINRWNHAVERIPDRLNPEYLHMVATSGHFYNHNVEANVERVGIGMYGVTDYASDLDLLPALSLRTHIGATKQVPAGEYVGYNRTFQAEKDTEVAVLPIGYQEGVDRRLSNKGHVLVGDHSCPIVGKVSMNATMVDITGTETVSKGDSVDVISADPQAPNTTLTIAEKIGTIPYTILVHISQELRRTIANFD